MIAVMSERVDRLKHELRVKIREDRRAMSAAQRCEAGEALGDRLRELVTEQRAQRFSCFLSTRSEPDTAPFLAVAEAAGLEALLPSSREDGLLDWIRPSGEGNVRGAFGIEEPLGEFMGPSALSGVDLMLIPAAAVDQRGLRLGWGRGYFDRALASIERRPPVFAVVFDHEVLDQVPTEAHDEPVDGVVTPARIIRF